MTEPCECCDLDPAYCGKAAEKRQRAEAEAEKDRIKSLPNVMASQFKGSCGQCGVWFEAGTLIQRQTHLAAYTWVAECCL